MRNCQATTIATQGHSSLAGFPVPRVCLSQNAGSWVKMVLLLVLLSRLAGADINGSIAGVVTDPSGAVVPNVPVTAVNKDTGVEQTVRTNNAGFYSFPELPVGTYELVIDQTGFKEFRQSGLVIHNNSALRIDAKLQVGETKQSITVLSSSVQVETVSTQMGEVITGSSMTAMPLNGRAYTDLLALQPGVVPLNTSEYQSFAPSGELNPGNLSMSGMRESANGFMVNGGNVQEEGQMGTQVIPDLDSIAEFRIITNNFDAEYGNYMGGQVNVITKSGTNQFHGDAFEFLRFPNLDARNYYSATRATLHRNQFGGTFGGPIRRDKIFLFADYQGTREVAGQDTGEIPVPSAADRTGNLADVADTLTGTVSGPAWAQSLSKELGKLVTVGEPYYFSGCPSSKCVFPNAVIPAAAMSVPSTRLLQLGVIPPANVPNTNFYSSAAYNQTIRDDKFSVRVDANTKLGTLSAYYFYDNYNLLSPFLSSNLPGYATSTLGGAQQANFGDVKTFSSTVVNEFRINYTRGVNNPTPVGGVNPALTPASLGFAPPSEGGLAPQDLSILGVPDVVTNELSFGVNPFTEVQYNNTYQILDNFTKVLGTHTLKFGANVHLSQITIYDHGAPNGTFYFDGNETGNDFADYLLGAVATGGFNQGVQVPMHTTTRYYGVYGEDSWRARHDLILNFGLRWEVTSPWYEKHNQIETIVPGEQSVVFPGAPTGWVFPGDPNIPRTLGPTRYTNFGPRIGLAYSPSGNGSITRFLFGTPGASSIRAGFGMFYTAFEDATSFNEVGDAPYGYYYVNPSSSLFASPFVDLGDGINQGQRFPVAFPPRNVGPQNPDNNVNWLQFLPIGSSPGFYYKNHVPYSEDYMLSFQRQLGGSTVLSISYVGTQGHRLLSALETNVGSPSLCLFLSNPAVLNPVSTPCGPGGEDTMYVLANGVAPPRGSFSFTGTLANDVCPSGSTCISGTRTVINPAFLGSNAWFIALANSGYNALEVSLKHSSKRASILAAYTYSKAMDNASSWGPGVGDATEEINPINPRLSRSLSAFDMTHNFVVSYSYELPFDRFFSANRLTQGWIVTGITRYNTGLPVTLNEQDDNSLLGTFSTGPTGSVVDTPNFTRGPLNFTDPRRANLTSLANPYFNISLFSPETVGQLGNSNRRFFHGPGSAEWDFGLLKELPLTESKQLEFRAEFYNIFNHTNFELPQGDITNSVFGFVTSANAARVGQLAVKFRF
ncbi:MAG TPA: carboxypeptidase regulatory-like domain-containing protein [Terriglobales bacterium]|nr:carboxypeptidase regulatory-like domain-containing protein [Terriglobales bacterium]